RPRLFLDDVLRYRAGFPGAELQDAGPTGPGVAEPLGVPGEGSGRVLAGEGEVAAVGVVAGHVRVRFAVVEEGGAVTPAEITEDFRRGELIVAHGGAVVHEAVVFDGGIGEREIDQGGLVLFEAVVADRWGVLRLIAEDA